jgi:hypothetical protein
MVVAMMIVVLLNYGYAVLLSVAAYLSFSAGQGLLLWASNMAIVSVPWVLAQAMVRARSDAERHSAVRFAKLVSVGSGCAAVVVGAIVIRFTSPLRTLVLAFSIFVIFLSTATVGWLQGRERLLVSLPVPLPLTPALGAAAVPAPYWQKVVEPAAVGSRAAVRAAAAPAGGRREQRVVTQ